MNAKKTRSSRSLTMLISAAVLAAVLAVSGCGDDADDGGSATSGSAGGDVYTGAFEVVENPPEGTGEITGTAEVAVSDEGTVAQIDLAGLEPDTAYASHLHAGACDQPDPGGPHFKFDLDGPEMPPNEIHLPFTSDADGNGFAEASNGAAVPDPGTRAIVVHLADDPGHSSSSSEKEDMEGHSEDMEHSDEEADSEDMEGHSAGDGHSGHTHQPKLVCAKLG